MDKKDAVAFLKKIANEAYRLAIRFGPTRFLDRIYLARDVPAPRLTINDGMTNYLRDIGNHEGKRILEIGSREVTGKSTARALFNKAHWVGFDYYPGPNVDVVGDAHQLSTYFDQKFDVIYSGGVFEHLAMPWVVAEHISKLLKIGGTVYIKTHFATSSHERPWHFFHFSDMGLRALFSSELGFECIEASMSNPIVGRYSAFAEDHLKFYPIGRLYCHSEFVGRKTKDVENFDWSKVNVSKMVDGTRYPNNTERF